MVIKIGRYFYKDIPMDDHGQPKECVEDILKEVYALVDYDGEPIKFLRRIKRPQTI